MKRRTIAAELRAQREHSKWIDWHSTSDPNKSASPPPPQYKDCRNCPYAQAETEERREWCMPCVWESAREDGWLPAGPSVYFLRCKLWADLPAGLVEDAVRSGRLSYREAVDVEMIRRAETRVL